MIGLNPFLIRARSIQYLLEAASVKACRACLRGFCCIRATHALRGLKTASFPNKINMRQIYMLFLMEDRTKHECFLCVSPKPDTCTTDKLPSMALDSGIPCRNDEPFSFMRILCHAVRVNRPISYGTLAMSSGEPKVCPASKRFSRRITTARSPGCM